MKLSVCFFVSKLPAILLPAKKGHTHPGLSRTSLDNLTKSWPPKSSKKETGLLWIETKKKCDHLCFNITFILKIYL